MRCVLTVLLLLVCAGCANQPVDTPPAVVTVGPILNNAVQFSVDQKKTISVLRWSTVVSNNRIEASKGIKVTVLSAENRILVADSFPYKLLAGGLATVSGSMDVPTALISEIKEVTVSLAYTEDGY